MKAGFQARDSGGEGTADEAAQFAGVGFTSRLRLLMKLKYGLSDRDPMRFVVDAINRCVARVAPLRRFIVDAVHQLCTPFTMLAVMQVSCRSMVALTNKSLLFRLAEAHDPAHLSCQTAKMPKLAHEVVESLAPLARTAIVAGRRELLLAMRSNLVDSALRYSRPGA